MKVCDARPERADWLLSSAGGSDPRHTELMCDSLILPAAVCSTVGKPVRTETDTDVLITDDTVRHLFLTLPAHNK
jgi:hypothetical protein